MVYRLAENLNRYMRLFIQPKELRSKMGDDIKIHLGAVPDRYLEHWNKPNVTFYQSDEYPQLFNVPDVTLWGEFLVLNDKAYQSLLASLEPFGEFLPLNCEGKDYYLFNVLALAETFDALDEAKSEFDYIDGHRADLRSIAFFEDKIPSSLFRVNYDGHRRVFCDAEFKQLVEASGLNGLLFRTELEGFM